MNHDDIIRMAREATGGVLYYDGEGWHLNEEEAVRFASLVAAAEREACMRDQEGLIEFNSLLAKHHAALVEQQKPGPWPTKEVIDKAVAAEREACARMAEDCVNIEKLADDIRARGKATLPSKLVDFEYDGSYRHPSKG